ncbi:MAG: hypothetical protein NWP83_08645 [Spirosomaceae bacterium]|nr:hypothetical protein [Spirosomataceae bacterium]
MNHCPNESVELIATNCAGTINWSNGATGSRTTVVVASSTSYSATCTVSTCASNSSNFITFTCTPTGSKMKVVALDLNVILEGPYNQATGLMSTRYNSQGLLPGQTPVSQFGVPTPAGQPYNRSPWNYSGSENVVNYEPTVVGWLLVSVKNQGNTILYQTAALLHADTHVEFIKDFPELDTTVTYFLQVDHRNHLGVMSATMLPVTNGKIKYNFTASDSYIKPNTPAFGQKLIGTKYAMFVGDIDKSSPAQHYDINFADITKLRNNVGLFEQYLDADLNLDADINFNDLIIWRANSGKFSSITY